MKTRMIQLAIILVPILVFVALLWVDIVPSGTKVVEYTAGDQSPYINHLLPSERVEYSEETAKNKAYVRIIDEPAYFSVDLPQTDFDTVEVAIEFENEEQPVFEIGALVDPFADAYDLRPIQNTMLEDLNWASSTEWGTLFLDRTGQEKSMYDFLDDPDINRLATYHYDLGQPYLESGYRASNNVKTTTVSLRGHHQYVTYIRDEVLNLEAAYMDMNRTLGKDDVAVRVYNESGTLLHEVVQNDDENETEDQISSKHEIDIAVENLDEGVYYVELSGTSDIFWRELRSTQKYMTFIDRVYLGDMVGYLDDPQSVNVYTNAKNLVFETAHVEGIQTVNVTGQPVEIYTSHEKIDFEVPTSGVAEVYIPVGDLKVSGAGKYAFSREAFFEPDPAKLSWNTDLDRLGVDYILANYTAPEEHDEWLVNPQNGSTEFRLADIAQEDAYAKFIVSVPGIEEGGWIDIHKITLTFKKDPMTFWEFLGAVRDRLPFGL